MKRFPVGGAVALALVASLSLAGAAAADGAPRVLFHALGHAPVTEGTPSTVERFQLRNLEYHALHDVTVGFGLDDDQEPVSIACGFGGVQIDKFTCTYATIPARFLVRIRIHMSLFYNAGHPDHFTTDGSAVGDDFSVSDRLIIKIIPKAAAPAPSPAPTLGLGGLGVLISGGLTLTIG